MKIRLLSLAAIVILSFSAEKSRQLMISSRTGKERFTLLNCFDMSYGTLACILKEVVKLYLYYIRAVHFHKVKVAATQKSLAENLSREQSFEEAIKLAREAGNATARRASLQAKHIMGPTLSSGWDLLETIYVGGTLAEGVARSVGVFFGAYAGGIVGEGEVGWLGFVVGSQMGSWIGGRIGLMVYDVWNGVQYLIPLISSSSSSPAAKYLSR